MNITRIGLDLAKNVLQVHGVDERGKALLRKRLKRGEVVAFFARLSPCLIGMEACGSAHHWARELAALGHTVRLMAPQFVKPYVKANKSDARDAEAICEAVGRPSMRFVPVKTLEQQSVLSLHRARQGCGGAPRRPIRSAACWRVWHRHCEGYSTDRGQYRRFSRRRRTACAR
jgi:transposase